MRAFLLAPIVLTAVVSAAHLEQRSPFHEIRSSLVTRANVIDPSVIPNKCKKSCASTVNDLNNCVTTDCLCTDQNGTELKQCVDCLVKAGASSATGQSVLDTFVDGCNAAGDPVDSLTVGGGSSSSSSNGINSSSALRPFVNGGILAATLAGVVAYLF